MRLDLSTGLRISKPVIYTLTETKAFSDIFNKINKQIPFKSDWCENSAYYDYALQGKDAPVLENGELAKCRANEKSRLVFIGTPFGNIVVFERHCQSWESSSGLLFCNMPDEIRELRCDDKNHKTMLGYTVLMETILGNIHAAEPIPNIGIMLSICSKLNNR